MTIHVNGRDIGTLAIRRESGWNTLELPLSPGLGAGAPLLVEVRCETQRSLPDRRALGVAVSEVTLLAVSDPIGP